MTTGSPHDGVRFKISSSAGVIVKAFMREGRRAAVHDFNSLALTSTSERKLSSLNFGFKR